jgi:branched-chain amino acid transport system substrate-binding protein
MVFRVFLGHVVNNSRSFANAFACLVFLLTLVALQPTVSAQRPDPQAESIELAIVGPLVGTSFSIGMQFRAGVHAALASLDDGTLLGRPVRVSEHDDSCIRTIAERVAQSLVQDPPHVVIGHSCSATTVVSAPIYARHGVLQITPSSTAPLVTEMGIGSIFRVIGRDDLQGEMAAEKLARDYGDRRIGILRYQSDYSMGLSQSAIEGLARRGVRPTFVLQGSASATSYLDEIMQLIDNQVDVVYLIGGALDGGVFVRQARQMAAPFDIISSDTLVSPIYTETAGPAGDGVAFTFPSEAAGQIDNEQSRAANAAIRAQGMEPDGYTLLAYAATEIWFEGVRRAGSVEATAVAAAIRSAPLDTVLGRISFDDKGDIQTDYAPFSWYVWQDGQRVAID